jgi:hypothetical protein
MPSSPFTLDDGETDMHKSTLAIVFSAALAGLAGCASNAELVGTAAGAAVGSAVGGSKVATVAGGVVGYAAGRHYDETHQH